MDKLSSHRIVLLFISTILCLTSLAEYKTLHTSENGFKYYLIENSNTHTANVVSLIGDTILSASENYGDPLIKFLSDSVYGGYFKVDFHKIVDLNGKTVVYEPSAYSYFERTKNNKAYFLVSFDEKYAIYDLEGNFILKTKKDIPRYDELRNEFYKEKKGKRKYLKVGLPNLDYAAIAEQNKRNIKKYMDIDGKVIITDKEIDGFYYKEVRQGENVGILNFRGDTIIPLSRHYTVADFIPMNNGLGCFRVQKDNYIGIADLRGNLLIPFFEGIDKITFESGKQENLDDSDQEIPGYFLLEKGRKEEVRDISGEVIIPFKDGLDGIYFSPVKNHIGYFVGLDVGTDTERIYDMSGELLFRYDDDNYAYYEPDMGFVIRKNYESKKIKSKTDIFLSKDGIGDYSIIEQKRAERARKDAEKKEKRRRRAQFWGNLAKAFAESLVQTAQISMAYNQIVANQSTMNRSSISSGGRSLGANLENPQYQNNVQRQLLNLSIAQVQFEEMQEYNQARAGYQRIGRDLTLDEFRALKGRILMEANGHSDNSNTTSEYKNSGKVGASSQTSGGLKCTYCNGTGRIVKNDNPPANFGIERANKICEECGEEYNPNARLHYHVRCAHCGGTGKSK